MRKGYSGIILRYAQTQVDDFHRMVHRPDGNWQRVLFIPSKYIPTRFFSRLDSKPRLSPGLEIVCRFSVRLRALSLSH